MRLQDLVAEARLRVLPTGHDVPDVSRLLECHSLHAVGGAYLISEDAFKYEQVSGYRLCAVRFALIVMGWGFIAYLNMLSGKIPYSTVKYGK